MLADGEAYHFSIDANVAESVDALHFSLKFDTETMSMEDVDKKLFSLYPNPAVDVVQLQSNLRLSLCHLESGLYIVQLTDQEGNSYTQELIKK